MKSKEFDELVKRSFENASLPYKPENWQKLSATLAEKEQRRKRVLLWPLASIAASVAMAIGIFAWVSNNKEDKNLQTKKTRITRSEDIAVRDVPATNNSSILPEAPLSAPEQKINEERRTRVVQPQQQAPPVIVQQQTPVIKRENVPQQQVLPVVPEAPVVVRNVDPEPTEHRAEVPKPEEKREEKKQVRSLAAITNPNTYYEDVVPVKKERKQFVTMAGGLNYGTLSSGYVMGFSAGTKLGSNFYVESDLAFVGNIANEKNQKTTFTPKSTSPYARTTATAYATTVTVQRYYNLYYAQLTPTLGYKATRSLSVGVGADVQRLLINQVLITETDNPADSRELPVYDMGLVGKTEYNLTKEIKASVFYRKGVNQALQGNNKILDRDYLQLQLKFNILNK